MGRQGQSSLESHACRTTVAAVDSSVCFLKEPERHKALGYINSQVT